ncbi:protein ALP1-like [Dendronephthya gigantea]|uniref:protein ALP1-like n=1 Tax=Dendronephthya gigantea TaxID=151771 RepID=UPI00106C8864|nr:protein ALP1-like [Dendronephthya gigantea]
MYFLVMRKNMLLNILLSLMWLMQANSKVPIRRHRTCRRFFRNPGWWQTVWDTYSDARFKKTLRISRKTFQHILPPIRSRLERQNINEEPVTPEERLAICLYRLGRGDYYHTISQISGLGVSTERNIVCEVFLAIVECPWSSEVAKHLPTSKEMFKNKLVEMEGFWQFPFCWAAVDGCHIPIKCPPGGLESCKEYQNFKNFYSVVLMAFVDARYRFIWASCGFPGNSHDAVILQSTDLWQQIAEGVFFPQIGKRVMNRTLPPLVLGDSAFPLQSWLMKPYTDAVLTEEQRYFNYRLSRARMVTEGAYGRLKGRWRVLLRKCESSAHEVKIATLACIVLHNACIEYGDAISKKCDLSIDPVTNQKRDRETVREMLKMRSCRKLKDNSVDQGSKNREALKNMFYNEKNKA